VGIIPALSQLTTEDYPGGPIILPAWKLMLWSLGLSFIGVFFAVPLRKQTIIKEKLKFPSGTATAQMIKLLHDHPDIDDQRRHENHELNTLDPGEIRLGRDTTEFSTCDRVDDTWTLKLKILGYSFSISSVYTLLSYFFPIIYALPIFDWITLNYVNVRSWEWYFNPSPSYIGQGIIMVRRPREGKGICRC
jgi:uncharacterized oligopeptide transporter (OPT) family protein